MPNFGGEMEKLKKVLLSFDKDQQIPGGAVSTLLGSKGSTHDSFLIQVLLDVCCSFVVPDDPAKKKQLCMLVNEKLHKGEVLAAIENHVHMKSIMQGASLRFMDSLRSAYASMAHPGSTTVTPVSASNFFSTSIYPNTYEQNFDEVGVIASGGFGTVYKAIHKIDSITYAVKKIKYYVDQNKEATKVRNEVLSIAKLSHVNIVSYKNCWVQLVDRDDEADEGSLSTTSSYASRQTDFDCSTSRSTASSAALGRQRGKRKSLPQRTFSNASSASSQQLTPHWSPSSVKKGFFRPTITEESTDSSSDSLEGADDVLHQLGECSDLNYHDDTLSDSLVVFDYGNQSPALDSSSTVTFLSEGGGDGGSAIVTRSSSADRRTPHGERLKAMLCIQMEYCDWDLHRWLEDRAEGKELPFQKDVRDIFRDIVQGVVHIHSKSIIHRDLKPSNIFYSKRDGSMKIGDFGLATLPDAVIANQPRAVGGLRPFTSNLGTFPYMAPEQRNRSDYDEKVDVYSLGIILLELLVPFKTRSEFNHVLNSVLGGKELPPHLTATFPQYVDLVENLLQADPTLRMSAKEILEHPLLQDTAEVEKRQLLLEINRLTSTLERRERELQAAWNEIAELKARVEQLTSSRC